MCVSNLFCFLLQIVLCCSVTVCYFKLCFAVVLDGFVEMHVIISPTNICAIFQHHDLKNICFLRPLSPFYLETIYARKRGSIILRLSVSVLYH